MRWRDTDGNELMGNAFMTKSFDLIGSNRRGKEGVIDERGESKGRRGKKRRTRDRDRGGNRLGLGFGLGFRIV